MNIDEKFLGKLIETPRATGHEFPAQKLIKERLEPEVHEVRVDALGNLISTLNPEKEPRILLDGHVDQIGFQISGFHKKGMLHFKPLGGFDPTTLPGKRVNVYTEEEKYIGVIGKKPIHLQKKKERKKVTEIKKLYIDIGAEDKEEAKELVDIGDFATFAEYKYRRMNNKKLALGVGFDDAIGAFIVSEVMLELAKDPSFEAAVFGLSAVQEEIGLRGTKAAAFSVNPDIGLATDVTFTSDVPKIKSERVGDVQLGNGPVLAKGPNISPQVRKRLEELADDQDISLQYYPASRGTPTDANAIQLTRGGVATSLISVPNRYMHTASEIISLDDVEDIVKLMVHFVKSVEANDYFLPL